MRLTLWDNFKNKLTRPLFMRTKECVHCGKFILNTKYRFHLLIHSYEKPFQCDSCHQRFPDQSYLDVHLAMFHKKRNSSCHNSSGNHATKINRTSSAKVVSPGKQNITNPSSSVLSNNTNSYKKEYHSPTTAEDRAKRYEVRRAKIELGVDKNKNLMPPARCSNIFSVNLASIPKKTKPIAALKRSNSTSTIAGVKIIPGLQEVSDAFIPLDNGIVRCVPCGELFYGLALLQWHWRTEHKQLQNITYDKSLATLNRANNVNPEKILQKTSNVLERNHKKILSSQWSRRLKTKYKKFRAKKPVSVTALKSTTISTHNKGDFPSEKGFKCQYCYAPFLNVYDFKLHLANHEGRKTHSCFFCPYKFLSRNHLEMHLKALHRVTAT